MFTKTAIQEGLRPVEKLYNPMIAKHHLGIHSPQYVGMERNAIKSIENKSDRVIIKTMPMKSEITLYKGHYPVTHVNLVQTNPKYTILERHPMFINYNGKTWLMDYSKRKIKIKGKDIPFNKVKWEKAKLKKVV